MLPTQLQPENFTARVSEATSGRKTLAGWMYHFFGNEPDETIDAMIEAARRLGIDPRTDEVYTDQYLEHMTPSELCAVWHSEVLPVASVERDTISNGNFVRLEHACDETSGWYRVVVQEPGSDSKWLYRQPIVSLEKAIGVCGRLRARGYDASVVRQDVHESYYAGTVQELLVVGGAEVDKE